MKFWYDQARGEFGFISSTQVRLEAQLNPEGSYRLRLLRPGRGPLYIQEIHHAVLPVEEESLIRDILTKWAQRVATESNRVVQRKQATAVRARQLALANPRPAAMDVAAAAFTDWVNALYIHGGLHPEFPEAESPPSDSA